jgi:hypothetical protein
MDKRIISFLLSTVASLVLFLLLGAKHTGGRPTIGFELILYRKGNVCWHIHHWIYMSIFAVLMTIVILLAKGKFTPAVMAVYGVLLGASLSDLKYSDMFKVQVACDAHP